MTKQEVLNYLDNVLHPIVSPDNWNVYSELYDMVEELPSAVPVRHGKWVREVRYTIDSLHSYQQYRCSECDMTYITNTKYCPNCGARMDEE